MRSFGLAALVALALAGCGEDRIDTARVEDEVEVEIEQQARVPVAEVACPKDVTIEQGRRFQCTVTGDNGGEATVQVLQTDDEGNVRFRATGLDALGAPVSPGE